MPMDILTLAYPMHSPSLSVSSSKISPWNSPSFWTLILSHSMHTISPLWICMQKAACVNSSFLMFPIPLGSLNTINTLLKCHGLPAITFHLSTSEPNLNRKILLPMLSIFTSLALLHACAMQSQFLSCVYSLPVKFFQLKSLPLCFLFFLAFRFLKDSLHSIPFLIEIALHFYIKSSMSMDVGHKLTLYLITILCVETPVF